MGKLQCNEFYYFAIYVLSLQLDEAKTDGDIDTLLDQPASMFIINHSGWSIVDPVTTGNKAVLLQHLIWDEVILRREGNIQAFKRGLGDLGLLQLVQRYPDLMKPLFVAQPDGQEVTALAFMGLVESLKPTEKEQLRAYDYFQDLVAYLGSKCFFLLQFLRIYN